MDSFFFFLIPKLAEWERLTENFEVSRKRIASGYVTVYCLRVHAFINGEWCLCVHVGQETRKPAADGMPDPNQRRLKRCVRSEKKVFIMSCVQNSNIYY